VKDDLQRTTLPVKYLERLSSLTGTSLPELEAEIRKRERFLQGLVDRGVHDMKTISHLAQDFLGGM
jgi:hypothetical protein